MLVKEIKSTRLILLKEEREIAKSWGSLWSRFGALERRGKPILLVFGDWSGYRSSQWRITHLDHCYFKGINENYHGTVAFTDNTTMSVWVKAVSRQAIINNQWYRKQGYSELIGKLLRSGETYYKV
jgi:hypothetical protein